MKKILPLIVCLFLFTANLLASEVFMLKDASKFFDVKINIASCEEDICEGKATLSVLRKNKTKPIQIIEMKNLYLELGENRKPTANLVELYGTNNSGVIFDDFNFDGREDLALRNGNEGAYGGPSYDILLFSNPKNKFLINNDLTKLASENLGLFDANKKEKTLETFNKSGCCWHQTIKYKIINNKPVKVFVFTEDAMSDNGTDGKVKLITEKLINGKWKKTVKTENIDEYYKDQ